MNVPEAGCHRRHSGRFSAMKMISGAARGLVCRAGLAAAAMLALSAATQQRAEALSLASPGMVPAAKYASEGLMIEVQGRGGPTGMGGGFRGGDREGSTFRPRPPRDGDRPPRDDRGPPRPPRDGGTGGSSSGSGSET